MLGKVIFFFALLIGGMVGIHHVFTTGAALNYLDKHPDATYTPMVELYIGEAFYIFQDLDQAVVYYQRISTRFPHSPYADDANFKYIECLEDSPGSSRATLIDEYQKYVENFPSGKYVTTAQNRMDAYRTGSR